MKNFIVFIFLMKFICFAVSSAKADSPEISEQLNYSRQAIWAIQNSQKVGKGFFIKKDLFVTSFHVITGLLGNGNSIKDIFLSQEGNSSRLRIKGVQALSLSDDLALLETEEEVTNYLKIKNDPLKPQENFFVLAHSDKDFKIIKQTKKSFYEDNPLYSLHTNRSILSGVSGGPVLNAKGQVVGVVSYNSMNSLFAIKPNSLKAFIRKKDAGLSCSGFVDPKTCIKKEMGNLERLAEGETPFAQYNLAEVYYDERNFERALEWYEKSANQGFPLAQLKLGDIYYSEQAFKQAFYWYKKAADNGLAQAQHKVAVMCEEGKGTKQNSSLALQYTKKSARQGLVEDQFNVAFMYQKGVGTEANFIEAAKWYKLAADNGLAQAQHNLAEMYRKGEGVEKNPKEAFNLHKLAAKQGYASSKTKLFEMYFNNEGGIRKNKQQNHLWLQKAAQQGFPIPPKIISDLISQLQQDIKKSSPASSKVTSDLLFQLQQDIEKGISISPQILSALFCYTNFTEQ